MYLDANFFVFAVLDNTKKGQKARSIQEEIMNGKWAITSVLALDEVMWVFIKNKKEHLLRKVIEDIYAMPNLEVREVSSSIPMRALEIMEQFGLKPRDAFHLSIMESFQIDTIVSDDVDFDKVKKIRRIKIE